MARNARWKMIERGTINVLELTIDDARRMRELMEKYRDLPIDLADAALVRVAERDKIRRIFTLDRDFSPSVRRTIFIAKRRAFPKQVVFDSSETIMAAVHPSASAGINVNRGPFRRAFVSRSGVAPPLRSN
jgi:hypothetical protein